MRLEIKIKLLRESFLNFPREYEVKFIFFPTGKFCKVKLYEQVSWYFIDQQIPPFQYGFLLLHLLCSVNVSKQQY